MAASCSCEAPAASLAPLAICSMARRSSSAAAAASVRPLASSSVAAARRSETLSCGRADTRRVAPFCWPLRAGGRADGRAGARIGGSLGGGAVPTVSLDFLTRAIGFPGTMRIARDGTQSHAYRPLDVATLVEFAALSKAGDPPDDGASRTPWTRRLRGSSGGLARSRLINLLGDGRHDLLGDLADLPPISRSAGLCLRGCPSRCRGYNTRASRRLRGPANGLGLGDRARQDPASPNCWPAPRALWRSQDARSYLGPSTKVSAASGRARFCQGPTTRRLFRHPRRIRCPWDRHLGSTMPVETCRGIASISNLTSLTRVQY